MSMNLKRTLNRAFLYKKNTQGGCGEVGSRHQDPTEKTLPTHIQLPAHIQLLLEGNERFSRINLQ